MRHLPKFQKLRVSWPCCWGTDALNPRRSERKPIFARTGPDPPKIGARARRERFGPKNIADAPRASEALTKSPQTLRAKTPPKNKYCRRSARKRYPKIGCSRRSARKRVQNMENSRRSKRKPIFARTGPDPPKMSARARRERFWPTNVQTLRAPAKPSQKVRRRSARQRRRPKILQMLRAKTLSKN